MAIHVRAKYKREKDPSEPRELAGYFDHRRRYEGDEFLLDHEHQFSEKWMERIGEVDSRSKLAKDLGRTKLQQDHRAALGSVTGP